MPSSYCFTLFIFIRLSLCVYIVNFWGMTPSCWLPYLNNFKIWSVELWSIVSYLTFNSNTNLKSHHFTSGRGSFVYVIFCIKIFFSFFSVYDTIILTGSFRGKLAFIWLPCWFAINLLILTFFSWCLRLTMNKEMLVSWDLHRRVWFVTFWEDGGVEDVDGNWQIIGDPLGNYVG